MHRREAFKRTLAGSLLGLPALANDTGIPPLPDTSLRAGGADAYWRRVRDEQFLLPPPRVFLNNGSLGVAPKRVIAAVEDYLERSAALKVDDYPRWGYETLDEERTEMAEFVGCKKDELAITHCATDALSMIAAGLDLKAGDEVVMTDQEHPSGKSPWQRRAQRDGVTIREVKIPYPPKSSAQLAELMISAIGPRTRVMFFSGIISPTGVIMPVREICDAARAKGVIAVVDGAHMNGQIPLRISDYNCDYFAGSPHKWMFSTAGCGLLYIREENLDRLWPTIATGGWDDKSLKAGRFMRIGTNNRAIIVGMMAGLRFLKELGPEAVYTRIHELARRTYAAAKERPYIEVLSSEDDRLYGSLVAIQFRPTELAPLWKLCQQKNIWTLNSPRLRLSSHIHTRPEDIDLFFQCADETVAHAK
jgi:isopenicillin-N epimerase